MISNNKIVILYNRTSTTL